ncbi:hypothetical protein CC78DRAFT_499687, partial [Lojkania enalia]
MVGVPGRSKGCSTCRTRKKKAIFANVALQCDLQEPTCGNCIKGKFVCGGYRRDMIVVQLGPEGKKVQYRAPEVSSRHGIMSSVLSPIDFRLRDLNRSALEIEYFDAFWDIYLPKPFLKARMHDFQGIKIPLVRWARWTQDRSAQNDTLRCALLALCISKVGWWKRDQSMKRRGIELYGRSLLRVAAALRNLERIDRTQLVATCRLLVLYEQLNDTKSSAANWVEHVAGLVGVLQLQPSGMYASEGNHELFLETRLNGAILALQVRKSTFLASPEWITEPFMGKQKTLVDSICDLLVALPGIVEEFDKLISARSSLNIDNRAEKLKQRCWALDERLQCWYRTLIVRFSSLLTAEESNHVLSGIGGPPQKELLDILMRYDTEPLLALALYWPCCLILYGMVPVLYRKFP